MKVQASRELLKANFFLSPKKINNLWMKFFSDEHVHYILLLPLFQSIRQSPGHDKQNCKQIITASFPIALSLSLSLSIFFEISIKPVYATMIWRHFQFCVFQIIGKCICKSKYWKKADIFTHFLLAFSLPPSW